MRGRTKIVGNVRVCNSALQKKRNSRSVRAVVCIVCRTNLSGALTELLRRNTDARKWLTIQRKVNAVIKPPLAQAEYIYAMMLSICSSVSLSPVNL